MWLGTNKYYLYQHIRSDTDQIFYVGIGTKLKKYSPYFRAYSKQHRNFMWRNIVKKAGYTVEILMESDDRKDISLKEIEFILKYGRRDLGTGILTNMTSGGEGLIALSPSTIDRMRRAKTGVKLKLTLEQRKEMSRKRKLNVGWHHSKSAKDKMRAKREGKPNPHVAGDKSPMRLPGRIAQQTGSNSWFAKPVLDLYTGIYYDCLKEASDANCLIYDKIRQRTLRGKSIKKKRFIYI